MATLEAVKKANLNRQANAGLDCFDVIRGQGAIGFL